MESLEQLEVGRWLDTTQNKGSQGKQPQDCSCGNSMGTGNDILHLLQQEPDIRISV